MALVALPAVALEQELALDATVGFEGGITTNPRVQLVPSPSHASFVLRPRLGIGARYGVTNAFYVGAAVDGAYSFGPSLTPQYVQSNDIVYSDTPGHSPSELWSFNLGTSRNRQAAGTLYAFNGGAATYAVVGYRPHLGYDYMGFLELAAGPAVGVWYNSGLVSNIGGQERLVLGPDELVHQVVPGVAVRVQGGFEARLHDNFSVAVMPYLSGSFVGSVSLEAGVAVRPSFLFAPYPL